MLRRKKLSNCLAFAIKFFANSVCELCVLFNTIHWCFFFIIEFDRFTRKSIKKTFFVSFFSAKIYSDQVSNLPQTDQVNTFCLSKLRTGTVFSMGPSEQTHPPPSPSHQMNNPPPESVKVSNPIPSPKWPSVQSFSIHLKWLKEVINIHPRLY